MTEQDKESGGAVVPKLRSCRCYVQVLDANQGQLGVYDIEVYPGASQRLCVSFDEAGVASEVVFWVRRGMTRVHSAVVCQIVNEQLVIEIASYLSTKLCAAAAWYEAKANTLRQADVHGVDVGVRSRRQLYVCARSYNKALSKDEIVAASKEMSKTSGWETTPTGTSYSRIAAAWKAVADAMSSIEVRKLLMNRQVDELPRGIDRVAFRQALAAFCDSRQNIDILFENQCVLNVCANEAQGIETACFGYFGHLYRKALAQRNAPPRLLGRPSGYYASNTRKREH